MFFIRLATNIRKHDLNVQYLYDSSIGGFAGVTTLVVGEIDSTSGSAGVITFDGASAIFAVLVILPFLGHSPFWEH